MDEQVRLSPDLALDRSEVVNVVVKAFLKAGLDHKARTRELVIIKRNGHLGLESVHTVHNSEVQAIPTNRS